MRQQCIYYDLEVRAKRRYSFRWVCKASTQINIASRLDYEDVVMPPVLFASLFAYTSPAVSPLHCPGPLADNGHVHSSERTLLACLDDHPLLLCSSGTAESVVSFQHSQLKTNAFAL